MFLKYSLIGLGSVGVVGVGGYAVYHEVSKNKKDINKDAKSEYGNDVSVKDGRAIPKPSVASSAKTE